MESIKTFKYLLSNYYHQDVWDDYKTDNEVWASFVQRENKELVKNLAQDVSRLLHEKPDFVLEIININNSGGIGFEDSQKAYSWLKDLDSFLSQLSN